MPPLTRVLYGTSKQATIGQTFTATIPDMPPVGKQWRITHVSIECALYNSATSGPLGAIPARLFVAGRFIAGSNNGQSDSLDGGDFRVYPSQQISVQWAPSLVSGILQGSIVCWVSQF